MKLLLSTERTEEKGAALDSNRFQRFGAVDRYEEIELFEFVFGQLGHKFASSGAHLRALETVR